MAVQGRGADARGRGPRWRGDQREGQPGRPVLGEHQRGRRHLLVAFPARRRLQTPEPGQRDQRAEGVQRTDGTVQAAVPEENDSSPEGEHQRHIKGAKGPVESAEIRLCR